MNNSIRYSRLLLFQYRLKKHKWQSRRQKQKTVANEAEVPKVQRGAEKKNGSLHEGKPDRQ